MNDFKTVTIAYGDGIGPEIMESVILILKEANAKINFDIIEVGKNIYDKGFSCGIMPSAWNSLTNSKVFLKAPITTPQGSGYKSLNVTMRKKLGLFANVRPVASFHPFVKTNFAEMDVVIIRENEEDLYMGIEYRQTDEVYQCLKIVTAEGCKKIIRYAFEYAINNNRKKVTCFSKDNIMKITDGIFHKIFDEIALEYPQIENNHYIVDIGTARLAANPEIFDVIVTSNLYGDIISDVAAEISGSVGLAGSANIGENCAMFEAIHGSAPDIAGKDIANPSGLINAAIMMLVHLGQYEVANKIRNALYKTIEDGIHTSDIFGALSKKKVGTKEFTQELILRLGNVPQTLAIANFSANNKNIDKNLANNFSDQKNFDGPKASKLLIGFDLFVDWKKDFSSLINLLNQIESEDFEIKTISSKGLLLWPLLDKHEMPNFSQGQIVLRFIGKKITKKNSTDIVEPAKSISHSDIVTMLNLCILHNIDFLKYEGLYSFNGKAAYSQAQGE